MDRHRANFDPRGAISQGAPAPGEDPDLIARFAVQVRGMFVLLEEALANRAALEDFRQALHKLAGTAAFFGKADLGRVAGDLDRQLRDHGCATPAFMTDARAALQRAAGRLC